ncbi:MAG: sigma-70 family RNA polymerase sigma factor [Planctomycetota bacterium]
MGDEPRASETRILLERWSQGDADALDVLLERNLGWVRRQVRGQLGAAVRSKEDSPDIVQEAVVEFLRFGPRFVLDDEAQLRALLKRIAEHVLIARSRWFTRKRRDLHREAQLEGSSVLQLSRYGTPVPERASRDEERELVRLAIELLPPVDREIVMRHHFDGESYEAIGKRLEVNPAAVRRRFARSLTKLSGKVRALRSGHITRAAAAVEDEDNPRAAEGRA